MTEQEWLASTEPWLMLRCLTDGRKKSLHPGERKIRLFACSAWRTIRFGTPLSENPDLPIVEAVEAWADG